MHMARKNDFGVSTCMYMYIYVGGRLYMYTRTHTHHGHVHMYMYITLRMIDQLGRMEVRCRGEGEKKPRFFTIILQFHVSKLDETMRFITRAASSPQTKNPVHMNPWTVWQYWTDHSGEEAECLQVFQYVGGLSCDQ